MALCGIGLTPMVFDTDGQAQNRAGPDTYAVVVVVWGKGRVSDVLLCSDTYDKKHACAYWGPIISR